MTGTQLIDGRRGTRTDRAVSHHARTGRRVRARRSAVVAGRRRAGPGESAATRPLDLNRHPAERPGKNGEQDGRAPSRLEFPTVRRSGRIPALKEEGTAMQTVTLSGFAVATLRFRVRGYRMKNRQPEAYRELVAAGIMEPDGDTFSLHRGWLVAAARTAQRGGGADRARTVCAARREWPFGVGQGVAAADRLGWRVEVTSENRPAFRELAAARIVIRTLLYRRR